ncbi:MAG TPA: 6-phosphofructokinase, partial [Candidatus Omnitrophica bacterium]|nr:6-phosphofructokinase [Candidatus Omnitrophota bacterium]
MQKIGILTGGADCPGLNSVIRAVVHKAMLEGYVVTGIKNGWMGLIENDMRIVDLRLTSGILDRGGTILGTSRLIPPLNKTQIDAIHENFRRSGMDAVIAVGGEDTLKIGLELYKQHSIPVVGVPKSIDNALSGTDYAFGFDTAVNVATECIDRLHTTAESHHRIMV